MLSFTVAVAGSLYGLYKFCCRGKPKTRDRQIQTSFEQELESLGSISSLDDELFKDYNVNAMEDTLLTSGGDPYQGSEARRQHDVGIGIGGGLVS